MNIKNIISMSLAIASSAVFADTVHLKSGSQLIGTIKSVTDSVIVLDSEDLGEVTIKVEKIESLEDAGEHLVVYKDQTSETKKLSVVQGAYQAETGKLDMANVKAIDPEVETWHGSINGAYTATRGNTIENSASVIANLNRRWEYDRLNFNASYYFSRSGTAAVEEATTTDRWELEGQEDHFWTTAFYSYVNLKYERDRIAELNSRYRAGIGGGYQWLDNYKHEPTGTWSFNQEAGVNWIREDYENGDSKKGGFAALRYAHHLKYLPKWNEGVECFHNLEYLPQVDDWEKYYVKADIGMSTKIIGNFDLLAKIEWDFNSQPADDRKKSDVRYIVGLGYKW